jgi:Carbon-nitrogen hydrolase
MVDSTCSKNNWASAKVCLQELAMEAHHKQSYNASRPARLIAVGNRMNYLTTVTEESFSAELERIVGLAVPYLAKDRPNLVALGEELGLPLALCGKRGYISRRVHSANIALNTLALGYARRIFHYRRLYPGISLVRALHLSLTDSMYRPFTATLSRLAAKYAMYLTACTNVARVHHATSTVEINHFGRRNTGQVYLPNGPGVYNTAFLWGPDGNLHGTTEKVFLTDSEIATLDLTPGDLDQVNPSETEMGKVGIAISLAAFTPEYLHKLDCQGTRIVIQNDANDARWAAGSKTWEWQPQEWLNSVLGCLQNEYPNLSINVCPMQVGNFFDITFDGQSSITMKSDREPDPRCNFVGNDGFVHTVTAKAMNGKFLAVAPWIVDDPIKTHPTMSVSERRVILEQVGKQLLPAGSRANQYRESVIWADVDVPKL